MIKTQGGCKANLPSKSRPQKEGQGSFVVHGQAEARSVYNGVDLEIRLRNEDQRGGRGSGEGRPRSPTSCAETQIQCILCKLDSTHRTQGSFTCRCRGWACLMPLMPHYLQDMQFTRKSSLTCGSLAAACEVQSTFSGETLRTFTWACLVSEECL